MNHEEKTIVKSLLKLKYISLFISNGFARLLKSSQKTIVFCVYVIIVLALWLLRKDILHFNVLAEMLYDLYGFAYWVLVVLISSILLILNGLPKGCISYGIAFKRINLTNYADEVPCLVSIRSGNHPNVNIFEFETYGISLKEFEDKKEKIASSLNLNIAKFEQGKNNRRMLMHAVSGDRKLPDCIWWKDEYLDKKPSVLVLGESLLGQVSVRLSSIPHILLGGASGSGKTKMLHLILMQCVKKKFITYVADFKGFVDFPKFWNSHCILISNVDDLCEKLDFLGRELEERKKLLRQYECANIDELNRKYNYGLNRIVFACDEAAELLDKTGLDKGQKEKVAMIEGKLSTLARQGRAPGIHLVICTQRPDANILTGQIKSNIDYRICGRADNVLSQIILDRTDASDLIPKDAQGRFLLYDGTLIQGYLFDEEQAFQKLNHNYSEDIEEFEVLEIEEFSISSD